MKIITDATLIFPDGQEGEGTVVIEDNHIQAILDKPPAGLLLRQENVEVFSGKGCYLTPGLIELHLNGGLGCNLNESRIGEVRQLLQKLPAFGITGALLTLITAPLTDMLSAIHTLEEVIHYKQPQHCRPLGIHLEGPFIHPDYRGTHPLADIRPPTAEEINLLASPMLKMITLAPELDSDGQVIAALRQKGIQVSMGHSGATGAQARQAVKYGVNSITHFYNAMRPFHHREPGIVGMALTQNDVFVQVIGDGVHVHQDAIKLLLRCLPSERILLTSDASPLAGLADGARGSFARQPVIVSGNRILNEQGGLAGSFHMVDFCMKNLLEWELASFRQAIQYASQNPAVFLNEERLGRLVPGCFADLVLWDKKTLNVETTLINGQVVYQKQKV